MTEEEKIFIRAYRRATQGRKHCIRILLGIQEKGERQTSNGNVLKVLTADNARITANKPL